jgi:hypothetical protein
MSLCTARSTIRQILSKRITIKLTFGAMITLEQPVYTSEVVDILKDDDRHILHMQWKRFADSKQYRDALMMGFEKVKEHDLTGWLGNLKHMESILPADVEWTSKTWFPLLAQTHIKKMAIVTSLDHFNNVAVKRIMENAEPVIGFQTKYFVDVNDARDWLNT